MANLFVVTIRWVQTPFTTENVIKVDEILRPICIDWLRFSGTTWIVETNKSVADIFNALAVFLSKEDSELIAPIDLKEIAGWAPKWVDDWLISKRPKT